MEYIHKEDDTVELEIDDWLTLDSWGSTPAVEDLIPLGFEDLQILQILTFIPKDVPESRTIHPRRLPIST